MKIHSAHIIDKSLTIFKDLPRKKYFFSGTKTHLVKSINSLGYFNAKQIRCLPRKFHDEEDSGYEEDASDDENDDDDGLYHFQFDNDDEDLMSNRNCETPFNDFLSPEDQFNQDKLLLRDTLLEEDQTDLIHQAMKLSEIYEDEDDDENINVCFPLRKSKNNIDNDSSFMSEENFSDDSSTSNRKRKNMSGGPDKKKRKKSASIRKKKPQRRPASVSYYTPSDLNSTKQNVADQSIHVQNAASVPLTAAGPAALSMLSTALSSHPPASSQAASHGETPNQKALLKQLLSFTPTQKQDSETSPVKTGFSIEALLDQPTDSNDSYKTLSKEVLSSMASQIPNPQAQVTGGQTPTTKVMTPQLGMGQRVLPPPSSASVMPGQQPQQQQLPTSVVGECSTAGPSPAPVMSGAQAPQPQQQPLQQPPQQPSEQTRSVAATATWPSPQRLPNQPANTFFVFQPFGQNQSQAIREGQPGPLSRPVPGRSVARPQQPQQIAPKVPPAEPAPVRVAPASQKDAPRFVRIRNPDASRIVKIKAEQPVQSIPRPQQPQLVAPKAATAPVRARPVPAAAHQPPTPVPIIPAPVQAQAMLQQPMLNFAVPTSSLSQVRDMFCSLHSQSFVHCYSVSHYH